MQHWRPTWHAWPSTPSNPNGGKRLYTNGVFNTNWDRAQ